MRDKLVDLDVAAAAATNSGMVSNTAEIRTATREAIEEILSKPLNGESDE